MKRAIVVGASSGIGKELALLLPSKGYQVGITGRRAEPLEDIRSSREDRYRVRVFDVSMPLESIAKLNELIAELGGLDLLILCSGTGELNEGLDFTIDKPVIDTNITGFTGIVNFAFTWFQRQGHGHLVAISSVAGLRGGRASASYNASKAYQMNYLEALRQKSTYLGQAVTVTDIRPGFVNTAMMKGTGFFWVISPKEAALHIWSAIRKRKGVYYISRRWKLIAGLLKILPRFLYERM